MKKIIKKLAFSTLLLCSANEAYSQAEIQKLNWDGLEVVWLEDERFPTYELMVYFADGALSDGSGRTGETSAAFNLLSLGTRRFSQKEIAENLEFFGASYGAEVTHEYSTFSVKGLVKDITPTMQKICHLFQDANYPDSEVVKEKKRATDSLQNLVNDHSALASRAVREISLKGTPFALPATGKLRDINRLDSKNLRSKLDYFNTQVKKRVYIAGPKDVLSVRRVLTSECKFGGESQQFVRTAEYKKLPTQNNIDITLITVPKSNQSQVRLASFLDDKQIENEELLGLASEFLGGGFTSKLMREVRVKRGLTYSINAFAAGQKTYGRSAISTFTKNETLDALLTLLQKTLTDVGNGKITDDEFDLAKGSFIGGNPFRFENLKAYLSQLMILDHNGKPYSELYNFVSKASKLNKEQVAEKLKDVFSWERQTLVVVGDKSMENVLKKYGKVKVVDYKDFL